MTSGTSATVLDKSGETWSVNVNTENCWEDLILTLGMCIPEFGLCARVQVETETTSTLWSLSRIYITPRDYDPIQDATTNPYTDGGGIRGYSSLLILQQLMHEVAECELRLQKELGPVAGSQRRDFNEDQLLPCHYFDYMYGTSTGGLISVMLARLRMTVPQCLEIYRKVGHELFGHRRNVLPLATKYHHKPLEKAVQDIVSQYCKHHEGCDGKDNHPWFNDGEDLLDGLNPTILNGTAPTSLENSTCSSGMASKYYKPTERICQSQVNFHAILKNSTNINSICLTATHSGQIDEAHLLRSYHHEYNPDIAPPWVTPYNTGADQLKIWQVTRATSAAPFYFEMLVADVGPHRMGFKDGGIRENNPSYAAYSEHASLKGDEHDPALLLSIGTGRPDTSNDGFAAVWPGPLGKLPGLQKWSEKFAVFKNVLIKYTEGEDRHKMMRTIARGEHRWYKRLNVDAGLHTLKLDNWEKGEWTHPVTQERRSVPGGKTLSVMEDATAAYLARDDVRQIGNAKEYQPPKVVLRQVAERLVRHRRLREETKAQDLKRWQTHMGMWLTGELGAEDGVKVPTPAMPRKGSRADAVRVKAGGV